MKLLILGANGQVGFELVECCKAHRIDYVATNRRILDISDLDAIQHFFANNHDFSYVINATAYTKVDQAEEESELADQINHVAVKAIAQQCKQYDIPLIHISTDYVFNGEKKTLYLEEDQLSALGVYGQTKLLGEEAIQKTWQKHIILRVSWVFGRHGDNFVKTMVKLSQLKEELGIVSDQYGSPTSAQDIARVIIEICQRNLENQWGIYHYTGFPVTTWHQLAIASIEEAKRQKLPVVTSQINAISTEDYPTPTKRPKNSGLDTQKIRRVFGVEQKPWADFIPDVVKTFK